MAKLRPLNSDELGEKGERFFDAICADAQLICNPARRDRAGWDRLVQFRFPEDANSTSLDRRPGPLSCLVQVKTVWEDNDTVRLRLSAAERLAKEPKPTFIYVVAIKDNLTISHIHLIHLLDLPLAKVLARLRAEHASGDRRINKRFITFSPREHGSVIEHSGQALRSALEQAVGGPCALSAYIDRKQHQINKLGFEDGHHSITLTMRANGIEEFAEAALGLRPIQATDLRHFETRFGFKLPVPELDADVAELTITPSMPTPCRLVCRREVTASPAVFQGEIRTPALPGLSPEHARMAILCDMFTVLLPIAPRGRFKICMNINGLRSGRHHPDVWRNYHRLMRFLASPGTLFQCHVDGRPPLEFQCNERPENLDVDYHTWAERRGQQLSRLVELTGLSDLLLTHQELIDSAVDVERCLDFLDGAVGAKFLEFRTPNNDVLTNLPMTFDLLVIFPVAQRFVAYSVVALAYPSQQPDGVDWYLDFTRFGELAILDDADVEFDRFRERVSTNSGFPNSIMYPSERLRKQDSVAT